jgi:hypothetical protein
MAVSEGGTVGMRYHHIGIPTDAVRPEERHLPEYGLHVSGYEESPFGVEWMRFDEDSTLPDVVKTLPHVAFEVDDLDAALEGHEVIIEPNSPSPGVTVAFILHDGAPVEFLCFADPGEPDGEAHGAPGSGLP